MIVQRYTAADLERWNDFVAKAKNGTFLFDRRYMDYHSEKFNDYSLLILDGEKLVAVFVANENSNIIESHGGLTYGGLVVEKEATLEEVLGYFFHILKFYSGSYKSIVYKSVPAPFAKTTSQEDLYAMFLLKAQLISRLSNSVYDRDAAIPYRKSKRENVARPQKHQKEYSIVKTNDPSEFWKKVLIPNLNEKFGSSPVHSLEEMQLLMQRFPSNIQLFEIRGNDILGGALVYVMDDIVHTQYVSATADGRKADILDVLIDYLITTVFADKSKVSLGTSNEDRGQKLNRGLMSWKEGFGARTLVHDIYLVETASYTELAEYA